MRGSSLPALTLSFFCARSLKKLGAFHNIRSFLPDKFSAQQTGETFGKIRCTNYQLRSCRRCQYFRSHWAPKPIHEVEAIISLLESGGIF